MNSILGGIILGIAVSVMLLFNGKVTGISGIVGGILNRENADKSWRVLFILGLLLGGFILKWIYPVAFTVQSYATTTDYVIAGFLVGFGTLLGNGCTSGHGVCGISRFSMRSILSTCIFITFGIISAGLFKYFRGEL